MLISFSWRKRWDLVSGGQSQKTISNEAREEERIQVYEAAKGYLDTKVPNTLVHAKIPEALQSYLQEHTFISHRVCNKTNRPTTQPVFFVLSQQSCLFLPEQINCCTWKQAGLARVSSGCLAASSCSALGASMGMHFGELSFSLPFPIWLWLKQDKVG